MYPSIANAHRAFNSRETTMKHQLHHTTHSNLFRYTYNTKQINLMPSHKHPPKLIKTKNNLVQFQPKTLNFPEHLMHSKLRSEESCPP